MRRILPEVAPENMRTTSPSHSNQTGTVTGVPSDLSVESMPRRVTARNAFLAVSDIIKQHPTDLASARRASQNVGGASRFRILRR